MTNDAASGHLDSSAAGTTENQTAPVSAASEDRPQEAIREELPPESPQSNHSKWKRRFIVAGGMVCVLGAALVLPPLVNIGRYQSRITALMTRALGRPVRLSSVELRLLPLPGFVLHDLSVSEDSAFGAEPILFARTVIARVAFLPLWQGRLEISRVSVDEASLNLVRNPQGRWNLESLMMGARPGLSAALGANPLSPAVQPARRLSKFPYLEATNSRVNLKNGVEKSPFSIVNADLSLWQDEPDHAEPGAWRVRLRGQPVRTDLQMSQEDTGVVRLEASLRTAGQQLREMPLHLQIEWREAELGQLSRLVTGSDAGWRGEVTADIDVTGTPEAAQTRARLRATSVRREEFTPDTPLDFDANCNFRYQRSLNALHAIGCDTAIGNGRLHLAAELPGTSGPPEATLEVRQVPLQAGLDLLRTLRSDFAPGITARGVANGSLSYKEPSAPAVPSPAASRLKARDRHHSAASAPVPGNLTGSVIVDQAVLSGGALKERLVLPRMVWTPAQLPSGDPGGDLTALGVRFTVPPPVTSSAPPARAPAESVSLSAPVQPNKLPLGVTVGVMLASRGFSLSIDGATGILPLRDLVYAFGAPHLDAVDSFVSGTATFHVAASGPWVAPEVESPASSESAPVSPNSSASLPALTSALPIAPGATDQLSGNLQLHHAQWKPAYLAAPVDFTQGSVTLTGADLSMTSEFSAGPAKSPILGTLAVNASLDCKTDCRPRVHLNFATLDAARVQAVLLGAAEPRSLFSPILDQVGRIGSSPPAKLPDASLDIDAETLLLGPNTLQKAKAEMRLLPSEIVIENWQAQAFDGTAKGSGHLAWPSNKPEYTFDLEFAGLSPAAVGELAGAAWSGGNLSGSAKLKLSGVTAKDLAASASGTLDFTWPHGTITTASATAEPIPDTAGSPDADSASSAAPAQQPLRFDQWTGSAQIANGKVQLGKNTLTVGKHSSSVEGSIPFAGPAKFSLAPAAPQLAEHKSPTP